jgi:hypothetical protein
MPLSPSYHAEAVVACTSHCPASKSVHSIGHAGLKAPAVGLLQQTTLLLQTRSERVCSDDSPIQRHIRQAQWVMASLIFQSLFLPCLPFLSQPTRQYTQLRLPSQKPRSRLHTTTYDSLPSHLPHSNHLSPRKTAYAVPCPGTARTSTYTSILPAQHRPSLACHLTLRARTLLLAMQNDPRQSPAGATDAAGASRPPSFRDAAPHEAPYVRLVVRSNPDTALPISDLPPPVPTALSGFPSVHGCAGASLVRHTQYMC